MFSAESGGKIYRAGFIDDPKSRNYTCPDPDCGVPVSHVKATTRSGDISVSEHFRHPKGEISHPQRHFTWQSGNIMSALLKNFDQYYHIDVETDARFKSGGLDFVVDMLLTENIGGHSRQTAVLAESAGFKAADYLLQWQFLTQNDISLMTVLSAQGTQNVNGKYCRTERRKQTGQDVNIVSGNEKMIADRQGKMIYFHHGTSELELVHFVDYQEYRDEDYTTEHGFTLSAGPVNFETKKILVSEKMIKLPEGMMGVTHWRTRGGLVARPETYVDYMFSLESRAEKLGEEEFAFDVGERIGIMLDGMDRKTLKELSKKYGKERLGGYYVE